VEDLWTDAIISVKWLLRNLMGGRGHDSCHWGETTGSSCECPGSRQNAWNLLTRSVLHALSYPVSLYLVCHRTAWVASIASFMGTDWFVAGNGVLSVTRIRAPASVAGFFLFVTASRPTAGPTQSHCLMLNYTQRQYYLEWISAYMHNIVMLFIVNDVTVQVQPIL
jgi:hypothetical protein